MRGPCSDYGGVGTARRDPRLAGRGREGSESFAFAIGTGLFSPLIFRIFRVSTGFTLMIPQNRVEQILLQHLESLGCNVMRPCKLIRYTTSPSLVAQVQDSSIQSIRAEWLIGCDGMHSTVRQQSGIAFPGGEYKASFVLADVSMEWPLSREEVTLFYSPKGLVVVAPLPQ